VRRGRDAAAAPIAVVAPRNMRFSPAGATSIDLHIHEAARWSGRRKSIVVLAEETAAPFDDVPVRLWPRGAGWRGPAGLLRALRPADWAPAFALVDHVWSPSAFSAEPIRAAAAGRAAVSLRPHPVDPPDPSREAVAA
jgi:hypothetical protein